MKTSPSPIRHPLCLAVWKSAGALFAALLCAATSPNASAQQTLPFYDPFPATYVDGTLLGAGTSATVWNFGSSAGAGAAVISNAVALTYPGLATASGYGVRSTGQPSSARDRGVQFTSQTLSAANPKMYASYLLNIQAGPTTTNRALSAFRASTSSGGGFTPLMAGIFIDPSLQLRACKSADFADMTTNTAPLSSATTHLIVVRYRFVTGANNDAVDVWVDPSSLGASEGSEPPPNMTVTNSSVADPTAASSFHFLLRTSASDQNGGGTYWLDEIRLGTNWANVTPSGGPGPVGAKLTFTTPPANTLAGQAITPSVVVQIQDGAGANVSSNNVPIGLTLSSGTGTLGGTTTQTTDASGKATFSNLSIDLTGTKQLTASASGIGVGLAATNSGNFTITAPAIPTRLGLVTSPPALAGRGETFSPQPVVVVLDQFDLPISNATDSVTVVPSSGTLLGTTTVAANGVNGRATFTDLRMTNQATATLTFSATGLTSTNASVTVGPGTAVQLIFTTQPGGTITNNGTPFPQQPVIKTADRFGTLSTFNLPASLPVTLTNISGIGSLTGTLTADLGTSGLNGVWSPTGIAYTSGGGAQKLMAVADWSSLAAVLRNRWSFNNNLDDVYGDRFGTLVGGDAVYTNITGNTLLHLTGGGRYVDVGAGLVSTLSNITVEVWAYRRQSGSTINNQRYVECGGVNPNDPATLTYFSVGPKLGWGTGGSCLAANREGQGAGGWATTNTPITDIMPTNSSSCFSAGNVDVLAENTYLHQAVRLDPQNLAVSCASNLVRECYTRVPASGWSLSALNDTNCFFGRLIVDSPTSHFTMVDFDEIRVWEGQLDDAALTNHVTAGAAQVLIRNGQSVQFNLGGTVITGQPRITDAVIAGPNLNLSGTGGVANATYYLRSSTDVGQGLSSWGFLQTNTFDAGGSFSLSTPFSPTEAHRFYRIQIP